MQAFTPKRFIARPAESEQLEPKSTTPHYLVNSNKVCKNSHFLRMFIHAHWYFPDFFLLLKGE
jgi:hypothetical protein